MALQLNHQFKSSILRQKTHREPLFYKAKRFQVSASLFSGRQLIESGNIRAILPKDASMAINSEGFILLDVRPTWEREKARVVGSVHVPIFVEDRDNSLVTLIKKWVHFGYIGLWTGQYLTTINSDFLSEVEVVVSSKDTKLLVACGEGLRSESKNIFFFSFFSFFLIFHFQSTFSTSFITQSIQTIVGGIFYFHCFKL